MYIRLDRILNERRKADKPNIHEGRLQIQNTSLTLTLTLTLNQTASAQAASAWPASPQSRGSHRTRCARAASRAPRRKSPSTSHTRPSQYSARRAGVADGACSTRTRVSSRASALRSGHEIYADSTRRWRTSYGLPGALGSPPLNSSRRSSKSTGTTAPGRRSRPGSTRSARSCPRLRRCP